MQLSLRSGMCPHPLKLASDVRFLFLGWAVLLAKHNGRTHFNWQKTAGIISSAPCDLNFQHPILYPPMQTWKWWQSCTWGVAVFVTDIYKKIRSKPWERPNPTQSYRDPRSILITVKGMFTSTKEHKDSVRQHHKEEFLLATIFRRSRFGHTYRHLNKYLSQVKIEKHVTWVKWCATVSLMPYCTRMPDGKERSVSK